MLHSQLARVLTGLLALVVATALTAPPALAGGPVERPLTKAAIARVAAVPAATLAQATAAAPKTPAAPAEKPFLKTTRGAIAMALLAGALGYTFYSFSHDRVKSPAK